MPKSWKLTPAQQAYEDGWRAHGFRIDGKANPFAAGTESHKAWRCGWLDAWQEAERRS